MISGRECGDLQCSSQRAAYQHDHGADYSSGDCRRGWPGRSASSVTNPTLETAKEVIEHPKINMLVATGGRPIVNIVLRSGKKAIGAGAGNKPALVDETACIRKAAQSIVSGASINNGIFCTCEKEVIVVDEVADALIKFMQETGRVYLLKPDEVEKVTKLVVTPERKINGAYIGKNVQVILHDIGIEVADDCRLAIFEAEKDHPLVWLEQMMPVLPIVRVKDVNEGIEFSVKVEQGNRHTAIMHSTHIDHMTAFARAVQTTIFIKNGPSFAGIGLGRRRPHLVHDCGPNWRRPGLRRGRSPGSVVARWSSRSESSDGG